MFLISKSGRIFSKFLIGSKSTLEVSEAIFKEMCCALTNLQYLFLMDLAIKEVLKRENEKLKKENEK